MPLAAALTPEFDHEMGTTRRLLERVPEAAPFRAAGHEGHTHAGHADKAATPAPQGVLAVPVTAVLDTGRRKVAYRLNPEGSYELRDPDRPAHGGQGRGRKSGGLFPDPGGPEGE